MSESADVLDRYQSTLDPFIKPREHVNYIRRVLALHLDSCSGNGPIKQPSSLLDDSHEITTTPDSKGVHRDLIEAIKANVIARRQYNEVIEADPSHRPSSNTAPSDGTDILEAQVNLLKLQTKQQRLSAVQKHFDALVQKPAASGGFLDVDEIFQGAPPLPHVPKEVVNGLITQQSSEKPDLKGRVAQLEKTVLRSKLLLRREEQLLSDTRVRARDIPDIVSIGNRLNALNVTRNELITWIETELSKASEDDSGEGRVQGQHDGNSTVDKAAMNGQLNNIKDKYIRYLEKRKSFLATMAERADVSLPPVLKPLGESRQTDDRGQGPTNHLLTPYIEGLLALSRKQKAMITQKSHINLVLSKEAKSAYRSLEALAEESHLLPAYPMQTSRRRSILGDTLTAPKSESSGFASRVQPWVFASDSAKLATFEVVAEKVESGQVALEHSMEVVHRIDHLLGQDQDQPEDVQEDHTEDDVWLETEAKQVAGVRKATANRDISKPRDAWSGIHGNLGLIGPQEQI